MRIALITNYWKNSNGGGVKNYVINLVDALREKGNEVQVLFSEGNDPEQFQCKRNKLSFSLACYRKLRENRPEVIFSQGTWYCLLPGVLYKRFNGCRLVHTFHTEPEKKLSFPAKLFFQHLLNACDCVTFVSKGLQERVLEIDGLIFSKTAITYAGVRAGNFASEDIYQFRETFQVHLSSPVLLVQAFTANEVKVQGLKICIQALKILKHKYPDILLLVTREGKHSGDLKVYAKNEEVKDNIIFTGDVQNPFIPIAVCDIFIFPWLGKSGIGLAQLEAMALGKPIVTFGSEAIVDGENGLIVEPCAKELAEKIDGLLINREYAKELGRCARKTVEEKFTWEQAAEGFLQCCLIEDIQNDQINEAPVKGPTSNK